jgi:hypothetical protein
MDAALPASADLKQRWPKAALGLWIVVLTVAAQTGLSLVTSALATYAIDRSSSGGADLGILFEVPTWAWRILGPAISLSFLLGLELMARQAEAKAVRPLARLAQALTALELMVGIGLDLFQSVFQRFLGGDFFLLSRVVSYTDMGLAMLADALLLEVLLRMRREASGAEAPGVLAALPARAIFWAMIAARVALMVGNHLLPAKWPGFWWHLLAVRGGITLGLGVLLVALALSALNAQIASAIRAPGLVPGGASTMDVAAAGRSAAWRVILSGGVLLALGLAVTIASLAAAQHGGKYVIAYGAIIVGIMQIIRGLGRL